MVKQEKKSYELGKLEKFQELLHTSKNKNKCQTISVKTRMLLNTAFLRSKLDGSQTMCSSSASGGDGHFKSKPLLPSPTTSLRHSLEI